MYSLGTGMSGTISCDIDALNKPSSELCTFPELSPQMTDIARSQGSIAANVTSKLIAKFAVGDHEQ